MNKADDKQPTIKNPDNPAFPADPFHHYGGLTKREHFAAMVLQGLAGNSFYLKILEDLKTLKEIDGPDEMKTMVVHAVRLADVLLKELEKPKPE